MLETQKFIMENGIEALATIGIGVKAKGDLFILNYNMIDAPKTHPVVMECRGLCVDVNYNLKAIAFPRFFNVGECEEITNKFNWNNFTVAEKLDGSLIKIFRHNGELQIQTRGSFADSELILNKTWKQAVLECLSPDQIALILDYDFYTFVFEYCSPYNQVVRQYDKPHLVLLTINHISNLGYVEVNADDINYIIGGVAFNRPNVYHFKSLEDMRNFMKWVETIQISTH